MKAIGNIFPLSRLRRIRVLVLLTMTIASFVQAGCSTPTAIYAAAGTASKYCQDRYLPGHLGWPDSDVGPHEYVLLVAFDTSDPNYDQTAVEKFFHINDGNASAAENATGGATPSTTGCMDDPDHPYTPKTQAGNWGLTIEGGCPKDCIARTLALKSTTPNLKDPLQDTPPFTWGIFFADGNGVRAKNDLSPVRVFQILTKNAVHSSSILKSLRVSGLAYLKGYKGEFLIGNTPKYLNQE